MTNRTGIIVSYIDVTGKRATVGCPGSGADSIDERLGRMETNGLSCCTVLRIDSCATEASAIQIGCAWLAERVDAYLDQLSNAVSAAGLG